MQKSKSILVSLVLPILVSACAQPGKVTPATPTAAEIPIAVVGPMSGDLSVFGEQLRRGAEMAVADINAKGGVLGRKLRLEIRDDRCEPPRAERIAQELVAKGVVFVDGHFCSGSSIPASKVYGAARILQITPASTNPALTEQAAATGIVTVMRVVGRDDQQGVTAANWLRQKYAGRPVAILDDGRDYGSEITNVIIRELKGSSVRVVLRKSFARWQGEFDELAATLQSEGVAAVYVGSYHDQLAAFVKALRRAGSTAEVLAADALNTSEFADLAGEAADGVRYTDNWSGYHPRAEGVIAAFRAQGFEPDGYALSSYTAIEAFAAAAAALDSADGHRLANWLRANTVASISGDLTWDAKGDLRTVSYAWYVWRNGRAELDPNQ